MLDEKALVRILTEPKNALVKQYQKLLDLDGVQLNFTPEAVELIAKQALERKTGARGLRAIIEKSMMDIMYTIPSDESIGTCTVTQETIEEGKEPLVTYRDLAVSEQNRSTSRRRFLRKHDDEIA